MDIFVLDYNKYIVDTLYLGNGSNSISEDKYIRYLKTGSNLGWCNYINPLKKKILVYDKITMEKKYVFNSSTECSDYLSELFGSPFKRTMITSVCNGYKKSYKGFIFKYAL